MELTFRDSPVHYSSKGEGKPIVLLHGFLESSMIWAPYLYELSQKRRVITIDLPGHGKTGTMAEINTMELMAEVVKAALEKLGISSATFVGHSMGGYVTLAFAEKYPESINELVLMNSTPEADSEEKAGNRDRAVKLVKKNKETYISMAISNLLPEENKTIYKNELEELKAEAFKFPTEGITASLKGMKIRTDRKHLLKTFNNRKYLIAGIKDPVIYWKIAKKLATTCNCQLILTDSGHLGFLEDFTEIRKMLYFID